MRDNTMASKQYNIIKNAKIKIFEMKLNVKVLKMY